MGCGASHTRAKYDALSSQAVVDNKNPIIIDDIIAKFVSKNPLFCYTDNSTSNY